MSLPIYQRVAVTSTGDVIPGAEVTVTNEATGVAQTVYLDRAGNTPLGQPFFANSVGLIQFFIPAGVTVRVTATGGAGSYTDRYVQALHLTESAADGVEGRVLKVGDNVVRQPDIGTAATGNIGSDQDEIPTNEIADSLRVKYVASIADLPTTVIAGQTVQVNGYHPGTTGGGGTFVGGFGRHNGGTFIDPSRAAEIGTPAYYVDSGVDANCFARTDVEYVTPEMFGAVGDGVTDDTEVLKILGPYTVAPTSGAVYYCTDEIVITGKWVGNSSATILNLNPSPTSENAAIILSGAESKFNGWILKGGSSSSASYNDRTYRGIKVTSGASEFEILNNKIKWFKVVAVESIGVSTSVPAVGVIANNVINGGSVGQLNGIVIKGGEDIEVTGNKAYNVYNQAFSVSDASRLTPISEYAQNFDIDIHHNFAKMIDPPAEIAANIDSAIKIGGGLRLKANYNTVVYAGDKTVLDGVIGKGIEVKIYDLAQQKARNDGALGTNEGVAFPFDESQALPQVTGNIVTGFSTGIFCNGTYIATIRDNIISATEVGISIKSQGSTIGSTSYTAPSYEGNTNTRTIAESNRIISLDDRQSGNSFVGIEYYTNYNRSINTEFFGIVDARHGGTNLGAQNFRMDADGRSYGASDQAKADLCGTTTVPSGFVNRTVSGPITQGGLSKIDLAYEGAVSDYHISIEPKWNTTYWITAKSSTSFTVNFGNAPAADSEFNWNITLVTDNL